MVKILTVDDLDQIAEHLDPGILQHIRNGQVNKFEGYGNLTIMSFKWYDIRSDDALSAQIIILFSHKHLFFLCEGESCSQAVRKLVSDEQRNERVLYTFFSELIRGDIDYLEDLEEQITETEDQMLTVYSRDRAGEIIALRRKLLRLKIYYEQLNQIFDGLTDNENEIISADNLRYFRILDNKINRLYSHVLNLRDYVTQVREAYQAQLDIEQNSLMRIFTVISGIFLPLTLLVGWYGMNLKMPEYAWKNGYLYFAGLTIAVVVVCILFFRRKKWL